MLNSRRGESRGYAPLAVASGLGDSPLLLWVHGGHLGVPLAYTNATGAAGAVGDWQVPGFPGQSRTFADLYYNRYRDYDPTLGRYVQADPVGLAGDQNPYSYVEGNPVRLIDPDGLDIAVIENGPTSGNPVGHTAIAVSGSGVYSFGNGVKQGSSLAKYLRRESPRRNTRIYLIKTTSEQDAAALRYLRSYRHMSLGGGLWDIASDNCAVRSNRALDAAKIPYPMIRDGGRGTVFLPNMPGTAAMRAIGLGSKAILLRQGRTKFPSVLQKFEPR